MLWHSLDSNFTENTQDIYHWNDKFTHLRLKSNLPWANELTTNLPNSIALKWKEKRDKTPAPQIIFGSAHPIDKVGQYLIYVKYCSPQRSPPPMWWIISPPENLIERSSTTMPLGDLVLQGHLLLESWLLFLSNGWSLYLIVQFSYWTYVHWVKKKQEQR